MLYGQDVAEAQAVFDEAFSIMQLAFSAERINFTGKHFNFRDVPVELRPVQQPHPPLWYGIGTPESAEQYGARAQQKVSPWGDPRTDRCPRCVPCGRHSTP
jgi:alkanesulfonate monooxygenase SsuD/methylene tetrahydromethanopterin reductase-like flavin-dependent oxidoreductase (luciferase family)